MSAPAIELRRVTKNYGTSRGVVDLDLTVEPGEVFGFLGPNGAGKTTTIRMLLDLIRPTAGSIRVFGLDARQRGIDVRRTIGYLPGDLRLPEHLTGRELLEYHVRIRGLPTLGDGPILAERLRLDLARPVAALSRGNRQKVGLILAFFHRPKLLVLDEPTSGLDPLVQQVFHELLAETRADGRTVFVSSHVLPEIQHVADRVALVSEGRLLVVDEIEALRRHASSRVDVIFAEEPKADSFTHVEHAKVMSREGSSIHFSLDGEIDPLLKALACEHVVSLESREADLEDVFFAVVGGGHAR